jgi:CRP/FNR family transcriptional regulator, cyclic AMP receptor protein
MKSLRSVSLFAGLSDDALAAIERRCRWHRKDVGELVIGHNDASKDIFFMVAGRARVVIYSVTGRAVAFREIGPGDFFGEMAAIDDKPRSASIEALARCELASMDRSALWNVLQEHPAVASALLLHFVGQIRTLTNRIYEFSTLAVANRIHGELLRLSRGHEISTDSAKLSPPPRHQDIAERISTNREAVAREFSRLYQQGLIERRSHALVINDLARLRRMVEEGADG